MKKLAFAVLFGRRRRVAKPSACAIHHPAISDFHTVVAKAGVSVTFKPTNSTYIFVADSPVIGRLGPFALIGVQHAGHNTGDYNSDEVQDMAGQVALSHAAVHFGDFTD